MCRGIVCAPQSGNAYPLSRFRLQTAESARLSLTSCSNPATIPRGRSDLESGEYDTFRRWLVFEDESTELEFPDRELRMIDAVDVNEDAEPGGFVEVPMDSVEFGRIAAQTAKQVIVQKVREAEREQVVEEYKDREGELLSGLVKRVDRNGVYIDLGGNAEGFVSRDQMVPRCSERTSVRSAFMRSCGRTGSRGTIWSRETKSSALPPRSM